MVGSPSAPASGGADECDTVGGAPGAMDGGHLGNGEEIAHVQSEWNNLVFLCVERGEIEVGDTTSKDGGRDDDRPRNCGTDEGDTRAMSDDHMGNDKGSGNATRERTKKDLVFLCVDGGENEVGDTTHKGGGRDDGRPGKRGKDGSDLAAMGVEHMGNDKGCGNTPRDWTNLGAFHVEMEGLGRVRRSRRVGGGVLGPRGDG